MVELNIDMILKLAGAFAAILAAMGGAALVIARAIQAWKGILQFRLFEMTTPKTGDVLPEDVVIDGRGAQPNWAVFLISIVPQDKCYVQDAFTSADSVGAWHAQYRPRRTDQDRYLYALSVPEKAIDKVQKMLESSTHNIQEVQRCLRSKGVSYRLSDSVHLRRRPEAPENR